MEAQSFIQTRGTAARFIFNKPSGSILLAERSEHIDVRYVHDDVWTSIAPGDFVEAPLPYEGVMSVISDVVGPHTALLHHVADGQVVDELSISLYVLHVRVDLDADRDGVIGDNEAGKRNWIWGKGQPGAIALVNNDRDTAALTVQQAADSELMEMVVRPTGAPLPEGCDLVLVITRDEAARLSLYKGTAASLELLLGVDPADPEGERRSTSPSLGDEGARCFLEVHEYPGPFFEGLVSFELQLREGGVVVGSDRAVVRVAPWIMTPHNLPVEEVYACDVRGGAFPNERFLEELQEACDALEVPLRIVPLEVNGDDRWIQDELEFGFSERPPAQVLPVVCDSPRDRELRDWASLQIGPDLGHFQLGGSTPNSLDSFGNLEVSPPVTVRGRRYPFGRIVFGGRANGDYGPDAREMMPELRRFFHAQKVQAPIEIYTDWLIIGHVDEILTFVPAENELGFQMLLASPRKAEGILDRLLADDHGEAVLFEGLRRGGEDGASAEVTVKGLLDDTAFWDANARFQSIMDLNREVLMMELEIDEADIIELPVLFWPEEEGRTAAFFPDLVNHLVIGNVSVVARPHGPKIDGEDAFEEAFRQALPDRDARFIDDWYSYHEVLGDVHCGTNTRRRPPADFHWWEYRPEGAFDV